jgi:hypothetical protein
MSGHLGNLETLQTCNLATLQPGFFETLKPAVFTSETSDTSETLPFETLQP